MQLHLILFSICLLVFGSFLGGFFLGREKGTGIAALAIPYSSSPTSLNLSEANGSDHYRIETPISEQVNDHATWVLTGTGHGYQSWLLNSSTSQATPLRRFDDLSAVSFTTSSREDVFTIDFQAYGPESSSDYFDEISGQYLFSATYSTLYPSVNIVRGQKRLYITLEADCKNLNDDDSDTWDGMMRGFRVNNRLITLSSPHSVICMRSDVFGSISPVPFAPPVFDKQTRKLHVILPWDERGGQWDALEVPSDTLSERDIRLVESR